MMPKRFRILAHEWAVDVVPEAKWSNKGKWGETDFSLNKIFIREGTPSVMDHTFYHELVHVVLGFMGEDRISKDESFVDLFGGLLQQVLETSEE